MQLTCGGGWGGQTQKLEGGVGTMTENPKDHQDLLCLDLLPFESL